MIEVSEEQHGTLVALAPDRSSDWKTNKLVIATLGSICISIALGFYLIMGIWMILPFAGLEVLALAIGLYYASWKLNYRHILYFQQSELRVEKGVYRPKGVWVWPKQQTLLRVCPSKQAWSPPALTLEHNNQSIEIGEFLGKDEANELIHLVGQHLQIHREPPA